MAGRRRPRQRKQERNLLAPECAGGGISVGRARQLTARLTTWMYRDFQGLFGPLHTPNLHRLLAHALDELRLRDFLLPGETGINEEKHMGIKAAYARTNRGRADHALQLLMAEQVADVLSWASVEEEGETTRALRTITMRLPVLPKPWPVPPPSWPRWMLL